MHLWIVLAAFAFCAVTPYLSAPSRSDVAQMMQELSELEHAESAETDEDGGAA
jgi:hypothetical protein